VPWDQAAFATCEIPISTIFALDNDEENIVLFDFEGGAHERGQLAVYKVCVCVVLVVIRIRSTIPGVQMKMIE
jgi:hypothetical protein